MEDIRELLKPRYKVIAEYPNSPFDVGDILIQDKKGGYFECSANDEIQQVYEFDIYKCSSVFKKLQWWEEREEKDMPEYVKEDGMVYKVQEWHTDLGPKVSVFIDPKIHTQFAEHATDGPLYGKILPSTQAEYEAFKNQSNGQHNSSSPESKFAILKKTT